LLRGYRGQRPADEHAVVDSLLRVSALLEICPAIQELDINPLKVLERGVRAVDVRGCASAAERHRHRHAVCRTDRRRHYKIF
jgi:acyl-CoA synthetase (NDP forming)